MRIHEVVLLPVPADRKVRNVFIQNSLVVNFYITISQFCLTVDVFHFDSVMQFPQNLVKKRDLQTLDRKNCNIGSWTFIFLTSRVRFSLQIFNVLQFEQLGIAINKLVELLEVLFDMFVIGIKNTVILFLPLLLQISPNIDSQHRLINLVLIHNHHIQQILQRNYIVRLEVTWFRMHLQSPLSHYCFESR